MPKKKMGEEKANGRSSIRLKPIGEHTVVFLLIFASFWLVRLALVALFGRKAKLFKLIEIEYIADFGFLIALIKYLWSVIKGLRGER
jgi:hypothetical protein